jgi:hypothetical protein
MKIVLIVISVVALIVLLTAPMLHALGYGSAQTSNYGMLVGTVGWFATAPFWMRHGHG